VDLPSFAQKLMKMHCSIFPSIADKTKHEVEKTLVQKAMCVHSAVSGGRLMQ
jgi:hypothetical protein